MYAVIELQGHQYIVQEGDSLTVDRMSDAEPGSTITVDALAVFDAEATKVVVGTPTVSGASVSFEVEAHVVGEKIHVHKFKNKNRYSRKIGFRPQHSTLSIKTIQA